MGSHARLGPSNMRWPHCPGSVREEESYEDAPGEAAIDGTGSHLLLELCLINESRAERYEGQVIGTDHVDNTNGWLIMRDRIDRVQQCLDYVARRKSELQSVYEGAVVQIEAETKSDPGGAFGRDDWWGTVDITITTVLDGQVVFIEVIDYKDGRGYVSEKSNSQLTAYLFGKLRLRISTGEGYTGPFNSSLVSGCRMTIVQPKTDPSVRYVEPSVEEVIQQVTVLSEAAHKTDEPDAPLVSGKHCQWCKANPKRGGSCSKGVVESAKVLTQMSHGCSELSVLDLFDQVMSSPARLTNDQLTKLAGIEASIQGMFDVVKSEIQSRLECGDEIQGYKMLPGRGSNKWSVSEAEVVKKLKGRRLKAADIYVQKLISPAQMMKLKNLTDTQKEKLQKELVTYVAGKTTLRQVQFTPVTESAEQMFGEAKISFL